MSDEIKIDYLLKQDFLTEEELKSVWVELDFLRHSGQLLVPEDSGSALDHEGKVLKQNLGVFLHDVYNHPKYSPILNHFTRKLFQGTTGEYACKSMWNMGILKTNKTDTLVSYYEDAHYYKPHNDASVVTALLWLWKEPKSFEGGELTLLDTGEKIPLTNNTLLMFPGHCWHDVSEVKMLPDAGEGMGRWCLSAFFLLESLPDACFRDFLKK